MSRSTMIAVAVATLATVAGCNKGGADASSQAPADKPSAASAEKAAEADIRDEDLPVAEDYEDEAESTISESNYDKALDELERDDE